jgi:VWFA-related protein
MKTLVMLAACLSILSLAGHARQDPQTPTFRLRSVLVPVDVRVLDRNGKPVTDLTQDDFTIVEDGVPQTIRFFERRALEAGPAIPGSAPPPRVGTAPEIGGQQHRVFLIVLRRLWLASEPFGTAEAITSFIRERLLPQDYVAVSAWGRASEFTTDHEQAAQVVERLKSYQETLARNGERMKILNLYGYGWKPLWPETQVELDEIFEPGSLRVRSMPRVESSEIRPLLDDVERRAFAMDGPIRTNTDSQLARDRGLMFGSTVLDVFAGIHYLRYIDGEKHLIYVSPRGLHLPSVEDDRSLSRIAADARVVIDVIQTGGAGRMSGPSMPGSAGSLRSLEPRMSSKHIAQLTGGQASFSEYPARAFARIDATTRVGYQLAYYPSNPVLDGRHRKLTVTVKRPRGATVLFRRSYLAQDDSVPYDHRQFVVQDRIMAAGEYGGTIDDVKVELTAAATSGAVSLEARIDVARVSFEQADDRRVTALEVAFFCGDRRERIVGELWQTVDLKLQEATYQQALKDGLTHTARVPVTAPAQTCKVVVYDYPSDRTGSAVVRVR